jgi:hypothetical protein
MRSGQVEDLKIRKDGEDNASDAHPSIVVTTPNGGKDTDMTIPATAWRPGGDALSPWLGQLSPLTNGTRPTTARPRSASSGLTKAGSGQVLLA